MTEETPQVKEAPDESTLETSLLGIDKPVSEAPSDEPLDDSAEAENKEGEAPLHDMLLGTARGDRELTSDAGLDKSTFEANPPGVDMPAPESPPDEPSVDDSAEAENTGAGSPLHELLLTMARDDEEPKKKTDLDELSQLLDVRDRVKAKDAAGRTALHLAAENGLVEAVTKLIGAKANILEPDNEGQQPIHKACSGGHLDVVNRLLKEGADTQITEEDGWSPLHLASGYGHTKVIQALLDKNNKNINDTEPLAGWTALNAATYHGYGDAVSALLEKGADVGIQDNDGWTPLMTAIKRKHEGLVKELLDQKGDLELETRNNSGHTPLLAASMNGFSAGASLLITAGADCNVQSTNSNSTPLITASNWGHSGVVNVLLGASRTNVNAQDKNMWTALHEASNRGHSNVVVSLLQRWANVELVNNDGQTALHLASKNGNEDVVKLLLDAKAKADARSQDGATALHLASGARPEDRIKQDDDEIGTDALSAIEREREESRSGQHAAVVELLLKHEAKPGTRTNKNETALHLAAARGDPARLKLVLASMEKKHMSIRNDQGRTALYLACTGDNPESAVESLLKSEMLRTAEFGTSNVKDDDIKQAVDDPDTHEIAKGLMKERSKGKEKFQPAGSAKWSIIEWAAYSQLPEVLSSLIRQFPGSSDTQAALKYALKSRLESTLQSAHELREDGEQSKFCKVLKLLIADVLPTPDFKTALKFVLDVTLDLTLGTRANQGAGHKQLLQVLSLLTDSFPGTPEIRESLRSALKLAKKAENQPQNPEQGSIPQKTSKDEAGTSSQKGKEKGPDKTEKTAQTALPAKELETDYLRPLVDILRDPPFSQTHKDVRIDGPPKHDPKLSKILRNLEATIVQFYKSEGESGTFRRYRSLKEVIYDHGPGSIMEKTISDLRKVLGKRSKVPDSLTYLEAKPKFTWVHLPATNMVWMNDILMRIMNDEGCEARQYHELKTFFRDSWTQVPDRTSSSRSMRPRTVVRRQQKQVSRKDGNIKKEEEEKSDKGNKEAKKEEEKKEEEEDRREESGKAKNETDSKEDRREKSKPDFGAASALYMPYFCFSTYYPDDASLCEKQTKFKDMKTAYEDLKGAQTPVIHESPTLDEWYYQFATDDESQEDRHRRNKSQVVTNAIEGNKSTKDGDKTPKKRDENTEEDEKNEAGKLTLVRVNQLWAWTIANKWLITATSCLFDDSNGTLVEGILEQLGKEAEAGGSASQPESATDMCRIIVDYCIGTYERPPKPEEPNFEQSKSEKARPREPKPQGQGSIRQLFSKTTNQIVGHGPRA